MVKSVVVELVVELESVELELVETVPVELAPSAVLSYSKIMSYFLAHTQTPEYD